MHEGPQRSSLTRNPGSTQAVHSAGSQRCVPETLQPAASTNLHTSLHRVGSHLPARFCLALKLEAAAQLADFLRPRVERAGGMMPLPDVYCLFNRARGTELVSPDDLLAAAQARLASRAPAFLSGCYMRDFSNPAGLFPNARR